MSKTGHTVASAKTRPMIALEGVSKTYPKQSKPAVAQLSLAVPQGAIVMLIGPSGCGKTTTLKMMNRLIEPTTGRILLDGETSPMQPRPAAQADRLCDPAGGVVSAPENRGQHRGGAHGARLEQAPDRQPG